MIYRPDIDGLRAIAILGVVLHHAFPSLLPGGFVGVDIFFVISGYLITHILLQEGQYGHINLARFYFRRIRRLFPALILVLLACLVYGWWMLLPDEYQQLAKHTVGSGLFILNLMLLGESGYFDVSSQLKPLLHLWSLSVEEQFYLLWPLLLLLFLGVRRSLLMPIWSILLGSLALCMYYAYAESAIAFYFPFTRFWELAAGGLLALRHSEKNNHLKPHASQKLSIAGTMLVLIPMFLINKQIVWPGLLATLPVLGALCLIHAGAFNLDSRPWIANSKLVWFGLISYPLYLWHWPILTFARIELGVNLPSLLSVSLVLISILLAWLTYLALEQPIRKISERKTFFPLASLLLLVVLIALFLYLRDGLTSRSSLIKMNMSEAQLTTMREDALDSHAACMKKFALTGYVRFCNIAGSDPKVALIGDSHARAMFDGLAPYMLALGESLANVGGRLFLGIDVYLKGSDFERNNNIGSQQATKMIIANHNITHVVMFALGPAYISGRTDHVFKLIDEPNIVDPLQIWERGIRQSLTALVESGKNITFVLNNPELTFNPRKCLGRPFTWTTQSNVLCAISNEDFLARNGIYRKLMESILADYPQVKKFDMAQYLCDGDYCHAAKNGEMLYRDDNHISLAGSRLMAPYLYRTIFNEP